MVLIFGWCSELHDQAKHFYVENIFVFISHQWFQVTPLYLFVLIFFMYACHWFILLGKRLKDIYSCFKYLAGPSRKKQIVSESRLHVCMLCVMGQQEENLSHARQRNHNIQSSRTKPSPADPLLCPKLFFLFSLRLVALQFDCFFFLTFLSAIFTVSSVLFFSSFGWIGRII